MSRYYSREDHIPETPDVELGDGYDAEEKKHQDFVEDVTDSPVQAYDSSNTPEALELHVRAEVEKVREGFTQVENTIKADDELNIVAAEMMAIISQNGALSSVEAALVNLSVKRIEKATGEYCGVLSQECFGASYDAHWASEASMEGVITSLQNLADLILNNVNRVVKVVEDFFASFTPLIAKRKKRAQDMLNQVNNSNREAGLKEVSGAFVKRLQIDGKVPEANTVIKQMGLLNEISKTFLQTDTFSTLNNALSLAGDEMLKDLDSEDIKNPSKFWYLAAFLLTPQAFAATKMFGTPAKIISATTGGIIGAKSGTGVTGTLAGAAAGATSVAVLRVLSGDIFQRAVLEGFKLDDKQLPSLIKVFPLLAKVSLGNRDADERTESYRSDFLLGNAMFTVTDIAYGRKLKNSKNLTATLSSTDVGLGVELEDSTKASGNDTIQALTSDQQRKVLEGVIDLLNDCEAFYKAYGSRAKQRYEAWRTAFKKSTAVYDKTFMSPGRTLGAYGLRSVMKHITNIYWNGIYRAQVDYIRYLNLEAEALTTYAYESMRNSQADN